MSIASLYPSINPSLLLDFANVKRLDPRITFTRTTTATYYDGVTTAKAEENLLVQSNFETSGWTSGNGTLTNNVTTAPDGTNTASLFVGNTTTAFHGAQQGSSSFVVGQQYTISFYVKAAGYTRAAIGDGNLNQAYAYMDLSAVTATADHGFSSVSITSVGNGWYRFVGTFTAVSSTYVFWIGGYPNTGGGTAYAPYYTGDGTSGVYLWGAQLEQRSSATAYTATTTQAITNYIPVLQTAAAGQARFDHNPTTGESLGLLIEEARTNQCLYSGDYTNAAWQTFNASKETTATVAPNGTLTACKIIATATSANHGTYQQITPSSTGVYATSIYVKAAGYNFACLRTSLDSDTKRYSVVVNLTNGAVTATQTNGATNTSYTVQDVGNGWYRVSVTASQSSGYMYVTVTPSDVSSPSFTNELPLFTGNGFSGIFIWGAQLEAGSFATSYIPTTGSTATRAQDLASMSGANLSSWFNNAQGTLYIDGARFGTNLYPRFAGFYGQNTETYSIGIGQWASSSVIFYGVNSAVQFSISQSPSGLTWGSQIRAAGAYAVNDVGFSANNTVTSVDTNATIPVIDIFYLGNGLNPAINGWLKKVAYYPIRVTNTQLQSLTV